MGTHMKTTVDITDSLFQRAKEVAAAEGITFRELVEQGLRQVLADRKTATRFQLRDASFGEGGLTPEAQKLTWQELLEFTYGTTFE